MARYIIPNYRLPDLTKQVNRIRNKGAEVVFDIITASVPFPVQGAGQDMVIDCCEVEVSGRYEINGWTFIGTIEHSAPENIIRLCDDRFTNRIPERYRTAGRDCEHCHIRRDRNDTYLVYNEDSDEFKQVGRTCLRGYTGGLDAETCASLASLSAEVDRLNRDARDGAFSDIETFGGLQQHARYSMQLARRQAYKYVEQNGYTAGETGRRFSAALSDDRNLEMATEAEVQNVTDYLENAPTSDYIRNVKAVWNKATYSFRDAGYITSAVASYFKDRDRQLALARQQEINAATEYAGEVGEKISLTVAESRVIYWRSGGPRFSASEYPVFRIVGTDGKIYIWGSTTHSQLHERDRITGTIKKLIERPNGEKQTELTRCKVDSTYDRPFSAIFRNNQ